MHFLSHPSFAEEEAESPSSVSPFQLIAAEEAITAKDEAAFSALPLLPVRQFVLFPGIVFPLPLHEPKHIRLIKKLFEKDEVIGIVAQKYPQVEKPKAKDIYQAGTTARILKVIVFPNDQVTVLLQGIHRFQIDHILAKAPQLIAQVHALPNKALDVKKKEIKALMQSLKEVATNIASINPDAPPEMQLLIDEIKDPIFLTYFLAFNIGIDLSHKQKMLATNDGIKRGHQLLAHLLKALEFTQLKQDLQSKLHTDLDQRQREIFLRHQIKVLQEELGDDDVEELKELRNRGKAKRWPKDIATFFNKTLDKAERVSQHNPDYSTHLNHAELLVDLPWGNLTKDNLNLKQAEQSLNKDHFGLENVKERILEYLAVLKLKQDIKGPIICFHGPPGVGKTTLCKSIAKALNRKYVRIALGGMNDEAEIRGHRKTYIGAMPGKIIQSIQKSSSDNPVIALDELDKISGMRGDPAAALLEVLDAEQNDTFTDNFLEVPYDLSKVMFVATANTLDTIPPALSDRMEIIDLNGYTLEEKVQIAKKYLLPKQRKDHGLKASNVRIHDSAIAKIVEDYTQESGVRELERQLGKLVRKVAKAIALEETYPKSIKKSDVQQLLGLEPFDQEAYQDLTIPGVAIGLAWTPVGGEILFIEATLSRGKGELTLSGQLGEIMKESAITAHSYLKAHAEALSIDYRIFDQYDLHIHVPAGAVPKDGPSAGITLFAALTSLYTQRKIHNKLAMTGEVTLRGKVLPVGGIKEKILAAKRAGITDIILSQKNKKDILEIQTRYTKGLNFHYVSHVDEVIRQALQPKRAPNARKWRLTKERAGQYAYA